MRGCRCRFLVRYAHDQSEVYKCLYFLNMGSHFFFFFYNDLIPSLSISLSLSPLSILYLFWSFILGLFDEVNLTYLVGTKKKQTSLASKMMGSFTLLFRLTFVTW